METMPAKQRMKQFWEELYQPGNTGLLESFFHELDQIVEESSFPKLDDEWYKDVVIYSLYVDLFNNDFKGLTDKLDYLANLGVSCLWLLPILDSPMRDAGFDISGYRKVRPALLGLEDAVQQDEQDRIFGRFLEEAHNRGIKVIFDIAINHTSDQHPWFLESRKSKDNPYRNYYIWNEDDRKYQDARIIFYGIEESNWKKDGDEYFFHRFFDFQPDLNYRNPEVLLEMSRNMLFWLKRGVDGFRADAIPYLWKEEGTDCENLPKTHTVVKFFRAVLDYVRPNTLLLAEACQKPYKVVKYFGDGDECNAGYHFPLMPQMFKAVAAKSNQPIRKNLSSEVTPDIPDESQWLTFLRCHDELSLELVYVSEEDRKYIHDHYCKKPEWDFRKGQGISARLSELMDRDPDKIGLITSIMLTLPGTPVIYYGDEFGKLNDQEYYRTKIKETGKDDTRFLVRGKIDWDEVEERLKQGGNFESTVYEGLKKKIAVRNRFSAFGRGGIRWLDPEMGNEGNPESILVFKRYYNNEQLLIIHNLSGSDATIISKGWGIKAERDLLDQKVDIKDDRLKLSPYGYHWFYTGNELDT
jgi:maltose alpha-D-glucosyltransferase/alpha-amylase